MDSEQAINKPGMNTIYDQDKDRRNWSKSIKHRNKLIEEAAEIGIKLDRPHEMKISELEKLVMQHYKNHQ